MPVEMNAIDPDMDKKTDFPHSGRGEWHSPSIELYFS
jgi:hypothetical protein